MDEGLLSGWALWYWNWRWERHLTWLHGLCIRAQEQAYTGGWRPAGPCLCRRLDELARIEEDMRHLILRH